MAPGTSQADLTPPKAPALPHELPGIDNFEDAAAYYYRGWMTCQARVGGLQSDIRSAQAEAARIQDSQPQSGD